MKSVYRNYSKGQVVVIFALSLIVLVGMVGLAIDTGRGYGVKAKLSAAVDAASIAAARALTVGATDAERIANAQAAAIKFYNANFPDNYLDATRLAPTVNAQHSSDGYWQVDVSGSATMPTYLVRVLSPDDVKVAASGTTIRRDLDMILVLDNSTSLLIPVNVFPTVKQAAKAFIGKFIESTDRVGLVSFAYGAVVNVPIRTSSRGFIKNDVTTAIDGMSANGSTAGAEGMRKALNEINKVTAGVRSSLRVIVFFSDGAPNTVPATFTQTSGSPLTVTGDLFSELSSGAAPQTVWNNNLIGTQLDCNVTAPPNPINDCNIATLPANSGSLTITDAGGTASASSILLAGQRPFLPLGASPYPNTRCNVNKAARNMLENVANTARSWQEGGTNQPIAIYSLGLGNNLNHLEVTFCGYANPPSLPTGVCPTPAQCPECGCNIMKRVANTSDSIPHYAAPQLTGLYCYADVTINPGALDSCFSSIASEILRLLI